MTKDDAAWMFSYGTLRDPDVQLAVFGRRLEAEPDQLTGYRLEMTSIDDEQFAATSGSAIHRTLQSTGCESDVVEGLALAVSRAELQQADSYEPVGYHRVRATLASGRPAWVYLKN